MFLILGYIIILGASLGTYAVHGSLAVLWVPMEYLAIFGLFIGGFIASNSTKTIKSTLGALPSALKGSKYNRELYMDTLLLLFEVLSKIRKDGLVSIEGDVDNPRGSPLFSGYPDVIEDDHVLDFLTDYLRMMVGGNLNTLEIEALMDQELEVHHHEAELPAHVMSKVADALPAFGIVVAVMGVVNVMSSVGQPPAILGKMIGGALIGTFLGILISYGFVAPIASLLDQKAQESGKIFQLIKTILLASMSGYAPQVAVEFGRKVLPADLRPSFSELEEELRARKVR